MNQHKFRGMIFDNGDILFDASVWRKWLHGEFQQLAIELSFEQLVEHWEAELVEVYRGKAKYWDQFTNFLDRLNVPNEARSNLTEAAQQKALDVQTDRAPMPGVPETLAELQALGVRLAVLSDTEGGEAGVRTILRQLRIESYFDKVIASSDIGHCKPEPAAFAYAVEALGLAHEECAFVAHDIDELTGAQQVDLFAIAYNDNPAAPRDATIKHFSELLEFAPSE